MKLTIIISSIVSMLLIFFYLTGDIGPKYSIRQEIVESNNKIKLRTSINDRRNGFKTKYFNYVDYEYGCENIEREVALDTLEIIMKKEIK